MTLTLDRARFAGQGTQGATSRSVRRSGIALCDIKIARSNTTKAGDQFGTVQLTSRTPKTGGLVPARVGLYDATGRAPLASDKALMLQRFADDLRMLAVNERTFWPSENRQAFYVDGSYEGRVPDGTYELVATRGPEYRAYRGKFEVKKDADQQRHDRARALRGHAGQGLVLRRRAHPRDARRSRGSRRSGASSPPRTCYVGNLLEMGNITDTSTSSSRRQWGKASRFERDGHFIVSGQEDAAHGLLRPHDPPQPRQPIHLPTEEYFLYHKVFEESKRRAASPGFAHMGWRIARRNRTHRRR